MPIKIPNDLPATTTLQNENIFVMTQTRAITQDIRPLDILILNLMPTKIDTETQFARLLGNSPLQVNLTLLQTKSHVAKNTPPEHLIAFYKTFDDIKDRYFDGMIITGAPVEHLPFEDVEYWPELCSIMDWSLSHVHSTLHICWGAQAGLYHHYGISKHPLPEKLFGVFPHHVERKHPILLRGFDETFMVPHSRHTTILREDVEKHPELKIAAASEEAGIYAIYTPGGRQVFLTGHIEYDPLTLKKEYDRDKALGLPIAVPKNYFPGDDDTKPPMVTWRAHAHLLFSNWLNYFVYQTTPYDFTQPKEGKSQEDTMFRSMRRFGQQIPEEEAIEILVHGKTGILAVLGDEGYPYTVPVNYAYADGKIHIHGANSGHKIDAIRNCEKVSFCVIEEDSVVPEKATTAYRSVVVFGRARLLTDRQEILASAEKIGRKYSGSLPIVDKELAEENSTLACIEITPEHITGKEGMELKKNRR